MCFRRLAFVLFVASMGLWAMQAFAAEPIRVRVLSYNIQIGAGMDDKINLERTAKVISGLHPDLVALQEVDRLSERVGGLDEVAELARLTGMYHAFGKAREVPGGEYGETILSRYPLTDVKSHVFASEEGCESRAAVTAKVKLGDTGPEILFIGTHLEHANVRVRQHQADALTQISSSVEPLSAILAGDFNDTPDSPVLKEVCKQWQDASVSAPKPTWPADKPARKIDYVLYRPAKTWRVVSSEVVDEPMASDHRPVLVVLEWLGDR